jgi:hypothetical protein
MIILNVANVNPEDQYHDNVLMINMAIRVMLGLSI